MSRIQKKLETILDFVDNDLNKNFLNSIGQDQLDKLEAYFELLKKVSSKKNLVSKKIDEDELLNHVADCIVGSFWVKPALDLVICDVGSGSGLPGVILAILYPNNQVILVEANRKKCSFLKIVRSVLDLKNLIIQNDRVENVDPKDIITTKAAFSVGNLHALKNMAKPGTFFFFWTTQHDEAGIFEQMSAFFPLSKRVHEYSLQNGKKRVLLCLKCG